MTEADKLADLVEVNLLFAKAELVAATSDRSALMRALQHIDYALKDVRSHKRHALKAPPSEDTKAA